ncbi:hypothetical protein IscW_ISCW016760, partial [Ixodes scapularis]
VQYHPSPSPQYPAAQHCVGGGPPYGNVQGHLGQFVQRQQYSPDMRYTPCHAPAYPSSPAPPHAKPAPNWSSPDHHGGSFPQMMAPHRSPAGNQQMASYRPMVGPPPQSHSPSWSQSPRTTPSPLACHARSPVATQPPFSPPTPAPTPQLQPQQQQSAASPTAGIVPDAPPHPLPTQSANPARPVKLEPETSGSEADREREPASEVSSVGTDSAVATSDAASPAKRKRGRPFGAKNKVKEGGAPKGRRKPDARKLDAVPVTTPAATTLAPRGKLSGPYVRVVGTRERPVSTSVVNVAPRSAAEEEVRRKKGASTPGQRSLHGARRLPGAAGGHTSTLSPHYDAVTRDPTWLCAFCHRGSHHQGLGDLYGPYPGIPARLPTDAATDGALGCEDGCRRSKGKRRKSDSGSEDALARASQASRRARQRRPSEVEGGPAGEACGGASRELWVHEACATWTQGVYLGGHRVHGLQEAAQEAALLACCKCKLPGASVGCVTRGCTEKYHYQCAVERGCHLDFENFSVLCSRHKAGWKPAA